MSHVHLMFCEHCNSIVDWPGDDGLVAVRRGTGGDFPDGTTNHRPLKYSAPASTPVSRDDEAVMAAIRDAVFDGMEDAIRDIPSRAMDTLVPNTGPDVIERNDVWDALANLRREM